MFALLQMTRLSVLALLVFGAWWMPLDSHAEETATLEAVCTECDPKALTVLPIYVLGSTGKQHKIHLSYPSASKGQNVYLLRVLLQALEQSEGFKAGGLNYVRMKLIYETECPQGSAKSCLPGLDEVIFRYNIEDDRVNRRFWWFKHSISHFPEEHPFWFNVGRAMHLVDDDNYLSRTIATVNNPEHRKNARSNYMQLKAVTIYAPGVGQSSFRQMVSGFLSNLAQTGASGALAGVTAGIVND